VPPLTVVAVKVRLSPIQIVLFESLDVMLIEGVTLGLTIIVPVALTEPHHPVNGIL